MYLSLLKIVGENRREDEYQELRKEKGMKIRQKEKRGGST